MNGRLARLSLAALRYGESLHLDDAPELARRMYRYHAEPATPAWRRRLGSPAALLASLGLDAHGESAALAAGGPLVRARSGGRWLEWDGPRLAAHRGTMYKLYVSPETSCLRDALPAVLGRLRAPQVLGLKVGADLHNVLRPDKLVIYFARRADALSAGRQLLRDLRGMPAQGVPFTGELGGNGLVSWAADPPATASRRRAGAPGSWRGWVTRRLATALVVAHRAGVRGRAATRIALAGAADDGVVPDHWTPGPRLLHGRAAW